MSEDPRIGPLLDAARSDPYVNVRVSAIETLGRIGDQSILPILKKILRETRDAEIRQAAENAVQNLELSK
jgi:HEAT repeat protein